MIQWLLSATVIASISMLMISPFLIGLIIGQRKRKKYDKVEWLNE